MSVFPAEPFDGIEQITVEPTPIAVVRHVGLRLSDLARVFDHAYTALARSFAEGALVPAGPALAVYHGDAMAEFDLEIGFPVEAAPSAPLTVDGIEISASALPGGSALATTHIGGFEGLGAAWAGLYGEAASRGLERSGDWIEIYVSDPRTTAETDLRTDLVLCTEAPASPDV